MSAGPSDARLRLPREPYPGLRPFLDFEAALLFGRERQVREVIERLHETQFVAVLGGSGSGKSSLIHAGVVPELRSFGIPGAGDLWLPMNCTPGTNVSAEDSVARRHSPVTRLVRRFGDLLRSRGSEAADAARLAEMAEVFRQEAGFARLLDAYAAELAVPPGPDPDEARVLFVLDQFEELFHPTNKGVADAALLVERVLDHFFNPHPRCYVVLTMRSEHLNDCAAFLELPDAINKSSYLIRRLDPDELRDAIVGPAQRFLRLVARSADASRDLPQQVGFAPEVLQRLLHDVQAITHDPDHLPLLQHLLARLWSAALEREEMDVPVPAHIGWHDLVRAVHRSDPAAERTLDEGTNCLRACLENWPESIYRWHGEQQRAQIDAVLRRLAFKDPNTGLYSQQRVAVDEAARLLGDGRTRADLRALIGEGFLGSVDYLYWDDDDPANVTLKVSHEAFIRGWQHFRTLIDVESRLFGEFVVLLNRTVAWGRAGEEALLTREELRRLGDSGFRDRHALPMQREAWFGLLSATQLGPREERLSALLQSGDTARLAALREDLDVFVTVSEQRERERQRKQRRSRGRWLVLGALTLLLLPSAMFSVFIQVPVIDRAELLFDAGNRANRAQLTADYAGVGAAGPALDSLLRAAELIDDARSGRTGFMASSSQWLLQSFSWIPSMQRQAAFLTGVAAQTEPPVNGKLRQLLSTALWRGAPSPPTAVADEAMQPAGAVDLACEPDPEEVQTGGVLLGRLFHAAQRRGSQEPLRAVFVPHSTIGRDAVIALRGANYDPDLRRCRYGPLLLAIPMRLDPWVAFDSNLRYMVYSTEGPLVEVAAVTLQEIDWERADDNSRRIVQTRLRGVVTDLQAVSALRRALDGERVGVVQAWRSHAGRTLVVDGQAWRVIAATATRLSLASQDPRFEELQPATDASVCTRLATGWSAQQGFRTRLFEHRGHCFAITRGEPPDDGPPPPDGPRREQVLVAVYEAPRPQDLERLEQNPPAPIASLSPFGRVDRVDGRWWVGVDGDYAGWLVLQGQDRSGQLRWLGQPWSTCALWRLGRELQQLNGTGSAPREVSGQRCRGR